MSILVTGAAGFIGSHLVERLLDAGERVVGLDSFDDFYDPAIKETNLVRAKSYTTFLERRGDIRNAAAFETLPDDIDTVVHLAARAGVRPSIAAPLLYTQVNVSGTVNVLDFMRTRRIRTLVFASSSSVYGNNDRSPFREDDSADRPISPYAATKRAGELLCHTSSHLDGLASLCLRFFTAYGPRQRPDLAIHKFARLIEEGAEIPVFGDGSTARDYTYIDDLVAGITGAIQYARAHAGTFEIINLGESRTIELDEMVTVLGEALGRVPQVRRLPAQPGDMIRTYADISKARSLLGYDPHTGFREGVRKFVSWLRNEAD